MTDPHDLPGIKQSEIQKCVSCGKGVMHDNNLTFYIADIRYMVCNIGALQRQHGMEMMMGGSAAAGIAAIMGPDEDIAKQLHKHSGWVCMECAMSEPLAFLSEKITERADAKTSPIEHGNGK